MMIIAEVSEVLVKLIPEETLHHQLKHDLICALGSYLKVQW